LFMKSK